MKINILWFLSTDVFYDHLKHKEDYPENISDNKVTINKIILNLLIITRLSLFT